MRFLKTGKLSLLFLLVTVLLLNGVGCTAPPAVAGQPPETRSTPQGPPTLDGMLSSNPRFLELLSAAGLGKGFLERPKYTLLLPTRESLEALTSAEMDELKADPENLRLIMLDHIAPGLQSREAMLTQGFLTTESGLNLDIAVTPEGVMLCAGVPLTETDVPIPGALVHKIDGLLLELVESQEPEMEEEPDDYLVEEEPNLEGTGGTETETLET